MTNAYQEGREARERNEPLSHVLSDMTVISYSTYELAKHIEKGWLDKHYELADELSG